MNKRRLRGRAVSRSARSGRPTRAPRAASARTGLEVWKLGGASLADASAVRRAVGLVQKHTGDVVVVVSALKGVTDALLEGAHRSASGDVAAASAQAAAFLRRHRALVLDLIAPGSDRRRLLAEADRAAREYREICRAVAALGHLSPRTSDVLVSRGERVAASIVAATRRVSSSVPFARRRVSWRSTTACSTPSPTRSSSARRRRGVRPVSAPRRKSSAVT